MQFKKELPGSSVESTLMGEEGEIGDHLGGYCLIQVRGDGGWHQGGARVIVLLSVPSGPCNRATFRSARRPACHYLSPSLLSSLDLVCCPLLMLLSAIVAAIWGSQPLVGAAAPDVACIPAYLCQNCPDLHKSLTSTVWAAFPLPTH